MKTRKPFLTWVSPRTVVSVFACFCVLGQFSVQAEDADPKPEAEDEPTASAVEKPAVKVDEERQELKLPGITIKIKERYVDVDAEVCLTEGLLELIACTKDTKEHESIIVIEAKAAHVHAALLLLGAQKGNPAMRKFIEGDKEGEGRWVDYLPSGHKIDVFLVVKDEEGNPVERPISDFLIKDEGGDGYGLPTENNNEVERFPTNTFLFAGSHVYQGDQGPARYLADDDGHVITISTFGNELLCLPGINTHGNEGLVWAVDPTHLPAEGSKVILRLRPQFSDAPAVEK